MKYLGNNDLLLLSTLFSDDSYGYAISKKFRELSGGQYFLKETTLYAALSRLEREGFISSYAGAQSNGKSRTYFAITEKGKSYYLELLEDWNATIKIVGSFIRGAKNENDGSVS